MIVGIASIAARLLGIESVGVLYEFYFLDIDSFLKALEKQLLKTSFFNWHVCC